MKLKNLNIRTVAITQIYLDKGKKEQIVQVLSGVLTGLGQIILGDLRREGDMSS